jgi:hypothetical protein
LHSDKRHEVLEKLKHELYRRSLDDH